MTEDFAGRFPERARFERELMLGVFLLLTARTTQGLVDPDLPGHLIFGTAHLASGALPDTCSIATAMSRSQFEPGKVMTAG